jgi:hypothetical protein
MRTRIEEQTGQRGTGLPLRDGALTREPLRDCAVATTAGQLETVRHSLGRFVRRALRVDVSAR